MRDTDIDLSEEALDAFRQVFEFVAALDPARFAVVVYGVTEADIARVEGTTVYTHSHRWVDVATGERGWGRRR